MLKTISIVPIFASILAALAYRTEPEQPSVAAVAVQHVAAQAAEADEPRIVELGTASLTVVETQWSDVYEVLETEVANDGARQQLGQLVGELETLAYAGEAGAEEFNAVLELTMETFWILTEEDGSLSYGERDLVFDVLMAAIMDFPMASPTTIWVKIGLPIEGQKCKTPGTATCDAGKPKSTCIKKKEQKKQKDGTYADSVPAKVKCETGSVP